jgi:4'-phosphopantetheinyl transferase EntD
MPIGSIGFAPSLAGIPAVVSLLPCPFADGGVPSAILLRFDVNHYTPSAFVQAGIACPSEIAHSVVKRQADFLFGRIAAHEAMRRLGVEDWSSPIGIGGSREPLWPRGVSGSISHAGDIAAAVAAHTSRHRALGVDIEQVASGSALRAITELSVDASERALLEHFAGAQRLDESITLAFSAKESLFKAAFASVGRYFDFDAARVTALDAAAGRLTLTIVESLGSGFETGRNCELLFAWPQPGLVMTLLAL